MESSSWPESSPTNTRIKAIQELTKCGIITNKLREMQGLPKITVSDLKSDNGVVVQILGMFENTLSILSSPKLNETCNNSTKDVKSSSSGNPHNSADSGESINTISPKKTKRGCYKRRKNVSTTIEITSNLFDDGYAWRKYGQKTILNSKHQRNYYRCSHKFEQGCQATKQVQKIDDEPSKYRITLSGLHTCNNLLRAPHIIVEDSSPKDNSVFINFETKRFTENHKVGTRFQSVKHTSKESVPSLKPLKHEQVSSVEHHTPWDPIEGLSHVSFEPMSLMSLGFDYEDMVLPGMSSSTCSTHDYKIESFDYGDLLFDMC
ncbi:putative WRKY transcription factor 70 [Bidens hawaiensis]|uniref:putative WRKY transcription factor 70 n=1 Tax=Bidens hawaiensis TaxID=980011 RepID=UPI0040494417